MNEFRNLSDLGKPEKLEVGSEVEYVVYNRENGGKPSAENVRLVDRGTIQHLPCKDNILQVLNTWLRTSRG